MYSNAMNAPPRPEDEIAPGTCKRCGMPGPHPLVGTKPRDGDCVDVLRDKLASQQFASDRFAGTKVKVKAAGK